MRSIALAANLGFCAVILAGAVDGYLSDLEVTRWDGVIPAQNVQQELPQLRTHRAQVTPVEVETSVETPKGLLWAAIGRGVARNLLGRVG